MWSFLESKNGKTMSSTIVLDLDGCLVDVKYRMRTFTDDPEAFYSGIEDDRPLSAMCTLARALDLKFTIIILTGRPERVRPKTLTWLERHKIPFDCLLMRPDYGEGSVCDFKLDAIQKLEKSGFVIEAIVDDNPETTRVLEKAGY